MALLLINPMRQIYTKLEKYFRLDILAFGYKSGD